MFVRCSAGCSAVGKGSGWVADPCYMQQCVAAVAVLCGVYFIDASRCVTHCCKTNSLLCLLLVVLLLQARRWCTACP
jgi:hypothetical protein